MQRSMEGHGLASDTDAPGDLQLLLLKGESCRQTGAEQQHHSCETLPIPSTFSHHNQDLEGGNAAHLARGDPQASR